jgi:hypothetical protein
LGSSPEDRAEMSPTTPRTPCSPTCHFLSKAPIVGLGSVGARASFRSLGLNACDQLVPVNTAHGIRSSNCRSGRAIAGRLTHRAILASFGESVFMSLTAYPLIRSPSFKAVGASKNCALIVTCTGVPADTLAIPAAPAPVLRARSAAIRNSSQLGLERP